MKIIEYTLIGSKLIKTIPWSEEHEEIAKNEALDSDYTVREVSDEEAIEMGFPVESSEPTQLDMIEAQVAYTAMITDTLLECY